MSQPGGRNRFRESGEWLDLESVETMLGALFAESQDAIGISSRMIVRVVNPALVRLFGYDAETELVGRPIIDLVAPDARDIIFELGRRRSMGDPVPPTYRTMGLRRDGSTFPLEVRSSSYMFRGELHQLTVLRDLTREEEVAHAIVANERFYEALFDGNPAMKILIDPKTGRIVDANQAAVAFYGWSKEALLAKRITEINTLTPAEVEAEMDNARSGKRRYFRFRHRRAGGDERHVEVHSGPVDIGGEHLLLSIIHDVTERDALEEQLRAAQRLEAVGRLAGGIAHDFNNLLTVMQATTQMIDRLTVDLPDVRIHLQDLQNASERASALTKSLLQFSRRQPMRRTPVSLNDVIGQLEGLLSRTLGPKITVESSLDPNLPLVMADRSQIEQVVMNLAINARDAMPDGGALTLTTEKHRVVEIDAAPVPVGKWAVLTVSDTGHGMDEETLTHVFEPFFTTKQAGGGSGLGLATVHGIVTQSEGHVIVESKLGDGTRFVIYLPAITVGGG